jgi:HEAT repeat protein
MAAIDALSNIGGKKAVETLIPLLKHQDHRARLAAIEALTQLEAPQITRPFLELLGDPKWEVRRAAASGLGRIRDPQALDGLTELLRDSDIDVRETAAFSLGRIGDAQAIGPLVLAMGDTETSVRRAAAAAVQRIDPRWAQTDAARRNSDELRKLLKQADDPAVRYAIVKLLDRLGHATRAVPTSDSAVVLTAAGQKQGRVLNTLVELLNDIDADVRLAAAQALGRLGNARAASALMTALSDSEGVVRRAAAESLQLLEST